MLIKNAERILRRSRTVLLMGEPGNYWLSDGAAMFPVPEFEELGQESVMALLSVKEKEAEKWHFEACPLPTDLNLTGAEDGETPLDVSDMTIVWQGVGIQPLNAEAGSIFVQAFYTDVFRRDAEGTSFFLRSSADGRPYIEAKVGLFLAGIIMPLIAIPDVTRFRAELFRQSFQIGERFREDEDGQMEMEGAT